MPKAGESVVKSPGIPSEETWKENDDMKNTLKIGILCALLAASGAAAQEQAKPKTDWKPLLGTWTLQMDMQGNAFFMTLELKLDEKGELAGTLSDQMGMMPVAPVSNAEFDGTTFKGDVKAQTPPDNAERTLKLEAKLAEGKLEGQLLVADMGFALPFTGTKK
jgi:hypothetical protein